MEEFSHGAIGFPSGAGRPLPLRGAVRWLARLLGAAGLAAALPAAVPLVKINDSLYQTEHCLFLIDSGNQFGFPDYNSIYSQTNHSSYLDTLLAQFPGTYFSI